MGEKKVPNLASQIVGAASSRKNQVWEVISSPYPKLNEA